VGHAALRSVSVGDAGCGSGPLMSADFAAPPRMGDFDRREDWVAHLRAGRVVAAGAALAAVTAITYQRTVGQQIPEAITRCYRWRIPTISAARRRGLLTALRGVRR
jgi:hypothetical protein